MKYIIFLSMLGLVACNNKVARQLKKCEMCYSMLDTTSSVHIKDSIAITFDTIIHVVGVKADTTIQIIEIVCDSTGTATIKTSTTKKGNRSDLSTSLSNNVLSIKASCDAIVDSLEFIIRNTERHLSKEVLNAIKVPIAVEPKLTWWQKIKIRFGGWAFMLIGLFVGYKTLKTYYKVNTPMGLILMLRRKLLR
jgi:hypothetical protein